MSLPVPSHTVLAKSEPPPIRFECPACRSMLESPLRMAGQKIDCPRCNQRLEIPTGQNSATPVGSTFNDFLVFRRMLIPLVIQVLFWIGVAASIGLGSYLLWFAIRGERTMALPALLLMILGPVFVRIFCELLIVAFRINETLSDIRNELRRK